MGNGDGDIDEWSDTSGESVKVENAHQSSPNTAYKSGSIILVEAGQLMMYSIQAKLLRRLSTLQGESDIKSERSTEVSA